MRNVKTILNGQNLTREQAEAIRDGDELAFDIETYKNYFLAMFYRPSDQTIIYFDTRSGFDKAKLEWALRSWKTYGFNSLGFDMPVSIAYCKSDNADSSYAYEMAQGIIANDDAPAYEVLAEWGLSRGWMDAYQRKHYDIQGPAFGKHSLKFYAAVLGLPELQDLPYDPHVELTDDQKEEVFRYCAKDCFATAKLREALADPMEIRREFGLNYGVDLRSLQDAKVAETLLVRDYELKIGTKPRKPELPDRFDVTYRVPDYITFKSDDLKALAQELDCSQFKVIDGKVKLGHMEGRVVKIAGYSYKMGVGGLHSQESRVTHKGSADLLLIDCDVGSYYPSLILRNGNYPSALGKQFLRTYEGFVKQRLEAKASGNKLMANGFKIPLNATFGKLGEMFGYLYAPELLIGVTLTGQLGLLMLIERLTLARFEVISANTDGVVSKVPEERLEEYRAILAEWMGETDFTLEETHYSAIYSRDVNSYIAFYADGSGYKAKGAYSKYGLSSLQAKVPDCQVVKDAVVAYLQHGTPVDETILGCKDFLHFTRAKNVKGGAYFDGVKLGKVVRFYYSGTSDKGIVNAMGHKVPEAWNVRPCMDLPDAFPDDLSYPTYIKRARKILAEDFWSPQHFGDLFD